MVTIIGIDAATQPKKLGLAQGSIDDSRITIQQVMLGSEVGPIAQTIASWISGPTLLAIDAPLGWPAALGPSLYRHQAGASLGADAHQMFRRQTDRFVHRTFRKLPLEVGADRIARTAHWALTLLTELRNQTDHPLPLAWDCTIDRPTAIEVYPAATLIGRGLETSGYKGSGADKEAARARLVHTISRELVIEEDLTRLVDSDDRLDALLCVVAGADFIRGQSLPPPNDPRIQTEGWIWVRAPRTAR